MSLKTFHSLIAAYKFYWKAILTLLLCVLCYYCSLGAAALTEEEIPAEITAEIFVADILGLPIAEPEKKEQKGKEESLIYKGSES